MKKTKRLLPKIDNGIKDRTAKQATEDEARATHIVSVALPGAFTNCDMDFFKAAGGYSDTSGCVLSTGERHHSWFVEGEKNANEMRDRLKVMLTSLDVLNKRSLGGTVTIRLK